MNEGPDSAGTAPGADAAAAQHELDRVQRKVNAARAVLVRLLQDVVVAESRLGNSQAAQILEANEQLVVTALHNQEQAQTASQALSEVTRAAELDALTQLPNRMLLNDRFTQAIAHARRHGGRLALLFLDLDGFKQINDRLGHAAGDAMLQQVAQRLSAAVRAADTVSRHGGDEFLILLTDVAQAANAALLAEKLLGALAPPFDFGDELLNLSASIGISLYPDDGETTKVLIDRADAAMYRVKHRGPGHYAFHGDRSSPAAAPAAAAPSNAHEQVFAAHQRRMAQLQEANEQLVLAALGAQEMQEAAERAQQRQADFMAAVAEELGDPYAPIRLVTAMLGRARASEHLLPRVQAIFEQQAAHMKRLVGAAIERSRAAAALPLDPVSDMAAVIDAAVDFCRPAIDLRLQRLDVVAPDGAVRVVGNNGRLTQLLTNLLDNASKYTPDHGHIRLEARVEGASVVLVVSDSGIGITADVVPHIFEPFALDDHAIGFNGVGFGIGLPVVRALVKELGGTVTAESAGNGRGSRFVVTLPLAP